MNIVVVRGRRGLLWWVLVAPWWLPLRAFLGLIALIVALPMLAVRAFVRACVGPRGLR